MHQLSIEEWASQGIWVTYQLYLYTVGICMNVSAMGIYHMSDIWKFSQNCMTLMASAIGKNFQISQVV